MKHEIDNFLKELDGHIERRKEALLEGSIKEYSEYCYLCGVLKGMLSVKMLFLDTVNYNGE